MKISLEQTGRITLFVLAVTLFTGCLVTGLLLTMWMRGRKTEIAVYVSLGLGKRNLLYQAASEGLVLYLASFCLSGILLPEAARRTGRGVCGFWAAACAWLSY